MRVNTRLRGNMTERRSTEERQEEIVHAAIHIIANEGLGKLTTANIARRVGISEGALFRHVSSKDDILLKALSHIEHVLSTPETGTDACPLTALKSFFLQRLLLLRNQPDLVRILFSMQLEQALGSDNHARINRLKQNAMQCFRSLLSRARQTKAIRQDLPVELLQMFLMGMLQSLVFHANFGLPEFPGNRCSDEDIWQTIEAFLKG